MTVIVTARDRYLNYLAADAKTEGEREEIIDAHRHKLVALFSDQAHSSTQKGCLIAGVKHRSIKVPGSSTSNYSLTGPLLRQKIEELKSQGLEPFYLTVTLGTTATCAIDNFAEIAEVLKDYPQIWVHVDAAYAGAALICKEYQHLAVGFAAFDSFNMNMHKWLLTNFDCRFVPLSPFCFLELVILTPRSCLFVKERKHLLNSLSITPSYLRNPHSDSGLVTDYRDWQIPLGRRFRALKIWFVMRTYGVSGLQAHIRNTISHGEHFAALIKSRPDLFKSITPPAFALTVFVVNTGSGGQMLEMQNKITKAVYERINEEGKVYITSTVLDGIYAIRVVGAGPKVRRETLERAFEVVVEAVVVVRDVGLGAVVDVGEVNQEQVRGV